MKYLALALLIALAAIVVACGDDDDSGGNGATETAAPSNGGADIDPADFTTVIDNPLFPISSFSELVYEGEEEDPDTGEMFTTRVVMTVMPNIQKTVAGVDVLVVQDQAFEDDEIVESTLDYFAQHTDGSVYYFGEDVDNYEDGEVADHEGSWLAGEGENQPGIIMPPAPVIGDLFQQEKAPGIAEDEMTVLSLTESVSVPAGEFTDCLKTEDFNPLDDETEFKFYCSGVGFVLEEFEGGNLELISFD